MKKLLAIALLASSSVAMADDDVGCGLGTILFEGKSGVVPKVLAATTNGTYWNQTFGITSGTLGCKTDGVITSRARLSMFMGTNADRLARDMSVGQGESLNVLADLMGVKEQDKAHFFHTAQANFSVIFADSHKTAGDVLAALQQVMAKDSKLAAYSAV
ncbi:DUF3015 family protein [Agitococcus lubricus]|uniref:DUF3015 family protein n=1 Tax=Agitococcus lubricus TaxID=1077255 RepID=A0A2T5IZS9_9GAMM|nr:DUF3015 family protein [Agitococcus lubricus]PTQ89499.1 Protein of unknown function (DUF3015) [Agitococcus lubricus]